MDSEIGMKLKNKYKKIFLDTCILSNIGRMEKEERAKLAYNMLVNRKYQIIVSTYILDELENLPDKQLKGNIYDFLELSYIFLKGSDRIFKEEISDTNLEIVEFNISMTQRDRNGQIMDFKNFRDNLFSNNTYKKVTKQNEVIKKKMQLEKRALDGVDNYFDLIILKHLMDNRIVNLDYNKFPAFTVWAYSLAHKVESKEIKKNYNEITDVAMSYIVPYVDIVIAERKQINLYNQLKNRKILKRLDNVIFKKYSDVFYNGKFIIEKIEEK